jgi:hypothetical protein
MSTSPPAGKPQEFRLQILLSWSIPEQMDDDFDDEMGDLAERDDFCDFEERPMMENVFFFSFILSILF